MSNSEPKHVVHNEAENRFELHFDQSHGRLEYQIVDGVMDLTSTEVPVEHRNHGHAAELAKAALEYAREHGLQVYATCSYIEAYLRKDPEYAPLVARSPLDD